MKIINHLVSLSFLFLTFSCDHQQATFTHQNNQLSINLGGEPPSIDPRKLTDNLSMYVAKMCFDGLTRVDVNGLLQLSLAENYELSEDQKTYIFKLKKAYWSNKKLLTAYDFEETWKAILSKDFPSSSAFAFYCIKNARLAKEGSVKIDEVGILAIDDQTLKIELSNPNPYFLHLLSSTYFFPYPESIAKKNQLFLEKKEPSFISIGPFNILSWKSQDKIILRKNESYWDKTVVSLNQINLYFVPDQNTEFSMYDQGEIDWMGAPFSSIPQDAISSIKTRKDFHTYKISGLYYYAFNTKKFPLNNSNIRKALTIAINRQEIIEHVFQTETEPATRLIPSLIDPYEKCCFKDGDINLAQDYFLKGCEELGIQPSEFPSFTLSYNSGPSIHYKIAQAIQQQWNKNLNIHTKINAQEWKVYLDSLLRQDFQAARLGVSSLSLDPGFFLEIFAYENSPINHTGWYNNRFSFLFEKALQTPKIYERLNYIHQAEELLLEEMPIAPLFFYTNSYLKKAYVENVVLDDLNNADFKWATINNK